jgi:hypothetical protein
LYRSKNKSCEYLLDFPLTGIHQKPPENRKTIKKNIPPETENTPPKALKQSESLGAYKILGKESKSEHESPISLQLRDIKTKPL